MEELGISGDHTNYSIIKIGQNTEESPRYLRRLAVSQSSVRKTISKRWCKNSQRNKIIIISRPCKRTGERFGGTLQW